MPRVDQATLDLLTDYFAAMKAKDCERIRSYHSDDVSLTFAKRADRHRPGGRAGADDDTAREGRIPSRPLINVAGGRRSRRL